MMRLHSLRTGSRWGRRAVWALAVTVVASACGDGQAAPSGGGFRGAPPTPVETDTVIVGQIARVVTIPGTVEAIRTVGVNAQVAGAVLQVPVEEGDFVDVNEVVARLDDRELQAQLRSAEAQFEVSEAAFRRAEQLRERQVITQPEYEAARTAYEAARAQVEQLRTRVGFTEVRSPISGVVTTPRMDELVHRDIKRGDLIAEVQQLDTVRVES